MKRIFFALLLVTTSLSAELYFTSYTDVCDEKSLSMIESLTLHRNCVVNLGSGNFTFAEDDIGRVLIGGMEIPIDNLRALITRVHEKGGVVSISFGSPLKPLSPYLKDTIDVKYLAGCIAKVLYQYEFDGVDIDFHEAIIDPLLQVLFIQELRDLVGNQKMITLTLPGAPFALNYGQIVTALASYVNWVNVMESNIWIDEGKNFANQVASDITHALQSWDIEPSHIHLGLKSDESALNVEEAKSLSHFAMTNGLGGISLYDLQKEGALLFAEGIMAVLFDGLHPPPIAPVPPFTPMPIDDENDEDFFENEEDSRQGEGTESPEEFE